jgi:hypothetical protein
MGHIDRKLQPIAGKATAVSTYSTVELTYRGVHGNKLCFSFPYVAQYFRSRGTPEEAIAERVRGVRGAVMTFALRKTLDDSGDWPASPPKSQISTAEVTGSELEQRKQERGSGTSTTTEWLSTTIQVCTPALPQDTSARYLTAASYPAQAARPPALFVWQIEDAAR